MATRSGTGSAYGSALGAGGAFSMARYSELANVQARKDRQHELNMRELEYMAGRQALGLDIPGQARGGSTSANAFLNKWQEELGQAKGIYNQALSGLGGTYESLRTAEGAAGKLGDLAGTIEQEYQGYLTEMRPLQQEMQAMAGEEAGVRRGLLSQFPALASYDPEAAAGRAIADVSQQAGMARQAEARRMAGLGIDPTSGRGAAAMRGMAGTEALGRAMGATAGRQQERLRAGQMTATGLSLIDPTKSAQAAMNIRQGGNQLLGMAAGLLGQQAQTLGGLAGTRADVGRSIAGIGSSYAQNIASPYADIAGLQMGLQHQGGALNLSNVLANRNPAGGGAVAFGGGGSNIGQPRSAGAQAEYDAFMAPRQGSGPVYNVSPQQLPAGQGQGMMPNVMMLQ